MENRRYAAQFCPLLVCLCATSCGGASSDTQSASEALAPAHSSSAIDDCLPTRSLRPEERALVGRYYTGDGLGFNLLLMLFDSGRYELVWNGCLGEYGRREGCWEFRDGELSFSAAKREGMLEDWPATAMYSDARVTFPNDEVLDFWAENDPSPHF